MKKRERQELHTKTVPELHAMVKDLRKTLMELMLEKAQLKLKNTTYVDRVKDKLAVVLTILRGKELSKNG